MYKKAVQTGDDIPWHCGVCSTTRAMIPNFESTRNEGNWNIIVKECYAKHEFVIVKTGKQAVLTIYLLINSFRYLTWNCDAS